jgi:SSS family solute:Na+ symporter
MSFMIGLTARGFLPLETSPDMVFTTAVSTALPPVAGAFVVMGLAAALMSGADSFAMMGSASIARDIYQQYFKPHASRREMLTVSRCSVVLMSVAAAAVALSGSGIIPLYILVIKICGAGLVFPVFALLFWKRATRAGVMSGMITGGLVTAGWHLIGNPLLTEVVIGYLASLAVTFFVSLATGHAPDEEPKAIYYEELDVKSYHRRFDGWSNSNYDRHYTVHKPRHP